MWLIDSALIHVKTHIHFAFPSYLAMMIAVFDVLLLKRLVRVHMDSQELSGMYCRHEFPTVVTGSVPALHIQKKSPK